MYKKGCKIVVLLIKPIAFVVFPLPSPSSYFKVPNVEEKAGKGIFRAQPQIANIAAETQTHELQKISNYILTTLRSE